MNFILSTHRYVRDDDVSFALRFPDFEFSPNTEEQKIITTSLHESLKVFLHSFHLSEESVQGLVCSGDRLSVKLAQSIVIAFAQNGRSP